MKNRITYSYYILLVVLLMEVVIFSWVFYRSKFPLKVTNSNSVKTQTLKYINSPSITSTPANLYINEHYFISFTKVNGEILLNYKGVIYSPANDKESGNIKTVDLRDDEQYQWNNLVESPIKYPKARFAEDELFDFKIFPNNEDFIFVMRWKDPEGNGRTMNVYLYDHVSKKTTGPLDLTPSNKDKIRYLRGLGIEETRYYGIPKVDQVSYDGEYISFNMYGCWNCGAGHPQKLVFNIKKQLAFNLGEVSDFKWRENGQYEYKEYIVKKCPENSGYIGVCFEDPQFLLIKIGQI